MGIASGPLPEVGFDHGGGLWSLPPWRSLTRSDRQFAMASEETELDQIVQELLTGSLSKAERVARLRELVRRQEDVPDELFEAALQKLMERLSG